MKMYRKWTKIKRRVVATTEDKTFGLKNKKGAKMKKYIQTVQASVQSKIDRHRGVSKNRMSQNEYELKKKKKAAEKEKALLNKLFETVKKDPKKEEAKKKATAGFSVGPVKKKKKKKKKKGAGKVAPPKPPVDNRPIEVIIEEKRSNLYSSGKKLTPVTPESFAAWKKKYLASKAKLEKKNKTSNKPSGRESYSKSKFQDDAGAAEVSECVAKSLLEAEVEAEEEERKKDDGDDDVDASLFEGNDLDVDDLGDLDEMDLGDE